MATVRVFTILVFVSAAILVSSRPTVKRAVANSSIDLNNTNICAQFKNICVSDDRYI